MTQAISSQIGFSKNNLIPSAVFHAVRQRIVGEGEMVEKSIHMRGVKVFEGHEDYLNFIAKVVCCIEGFGPSHLQNYIAHMVKGEEVEDHQLSAVLAFAILCSTSNYTAPQKEVILERILLVYKKYNDHLPEVFLPVRDGHESMTTSSGLSSSSSSSSEDEEDLTPGTPQSEPQDLKTPPVTPAPNKARHPLRFMSATDEGLPVLNVQDASLPVPKFIKSTGPYTKDSAVFEAMAKHMFPAFKMSRFHSISDYKAMITEATAAYDALYSSLDSSSKSTSF